MKINTDSIRLADAPGVGNGSARLAPAPYTVEWWQSAEMRRVFKAGLTFLPFLFRSSPKGGR